MRSGMQFLHLWHHNYSWNWMHFLLQLCIWKVWKLLDMHISTFQTPSRKNGISQLMNSSQKIEYITQFHTDYTPEMKHYIVMELRKPCPKIRVILAIVAIGMGLDAPSIFRVIHCRPPTTLENYLQEFGRAGRNGQKASALLYYNNSDIASNRKGISQAMVDYCKNSAACFRLLIVNHFGYENVVFSGSPLDCCSHCASWNDELIKWRRL